MELESYHDEYVQEVRDMYTITIRAYLAPKIFESVTTALMFEKCLMVFFLQIALASFFLYYMDENIVTAQPKFETQVVRLMCAFLMHLYIHPELEQALSMMRFLKFTTVVEYKPWRM